MAKLISNPIATITHITIANPTNARESQAKIVSSLLSQDDALPPKRSAKEVKCFVSPQIIFLDLSGHLSSHTHSLLTKL